MYVFFAPAEKMLTTLQLAETGSPSQFCALQDFQFARGLQDAVAYLTKTAS
jgi:hypothetical protein